MEDDDFEMTPERLARAKKIRELNDAFRADPFRRPNLDKVLITGSLSGFEPELHVKIFDAVRTFNRFNADTDPHHEHDLISVKVDGHDIYAKIDYYDMDMGSENPNDESATRRVMSIFLREDFCDFRINMNHERKKNTIHISHVHAKK